MNKSELRTANQMPKYQMICKLQIYITLQIAGEAALGNPNQPIQGLWRNTVDNQKQAKYIKYSYMHSGI